MAGVSDRYTPPLRHCTCLLKNQPPNQSSPFTHKHETAFRQLKRLPRQPKAAFTVACPSEAIQTIQPIPFVDLV